MAKTTKRPKNAAFSPNQETWIILEYGALRNVTQVRRNFHLTTGSGQFVWQR